MIYYFSATGNSEWVAKEIARQTGDEAQSISEMRKAGRTPARVDVGGVLGLVFPVYAWAPPRLVMDFAKTLDVDPAAFVYAVCTMGGSAGGAIGILRKAVRIDGAYGIVMPSNYLPMSGAEPPEEIARKIAEARRRLPRIAEGIQARRREEDVLKGRCARLKSALAAPLFNRFVSDKGFKAGGGCTGCGVCERICPLSNIKLANGRPVWHHDCMHCMACIQRCPEQAIDLGAKTAGRARYTFPGSALLE
jgi:NAD-dependent dihydropyrimidine dehydrogenase PreA subunit/flavodoxin